MTNKITIVIPVDEQADPAKVGEAIANLIKALTPQEDWETVAAELKAQVAAITNKPEQLRHLPQGGQDDAEP